MKKKMFLLILVAAMLTAGCGKNEPTGIFQTTDAEISDISVSDSGSKIKADNEAESETAVSAVEEIVREPAVSVSLESRVENNRTLYVTVTGYDKANEPVWEYSPQKLETYYADAIMVEEIGKSSDGYAYISDGIIYCIDLTDGSLKWTYKDFGGYNICSYVDESSNRYIIAGYDGPYLTVLSSDGEMLFEDNYIDKDYYWAQSMEYIKESDEIAVWYASCDSYVYYSLKDYTRRFEERAAIITEIDRYVLDPTVLVSMTPKEIEYYKIALDAVFAREETLDLGVDYDTYLGIMYALKNSAYDFLLSYCDTNRKNTAICFEYAYTAEEQTEIVDFMDKEYLEMINNAIRPGMSDLEKTLAIYKKIIQKLEYDYDWLDAFNTSDEKFMFPGISIYQALSTGKGVCHSYAYACQFALLQLGIEAVTLSADTTDGGGHMWLAVKYGDNFYHIDPTWDDYGASPHLMYFGMTDEENLNRGIVDNWLVGVNMEYGYFECGDDAFKDFRDISFYSLRGDGKIYTYQNYELVNEPIDLPTFTE